MSMYQTIRFNEIEDKIPKGPGIYEIYTDSGIALKVGISSNIRKRLLQHRASRQNRLKLKPGGNRLNPNDVLSKESILAKHLYYDSTVTKEYNLATENGRKAFLSDKCYIRFKETETKAEARRMEKQLEMSGQFRYIG